MSNLNTLVNIFLKKIFFGHPNAMTYLKRSHKNRERCDTCDRSDIIIKKEIKKDKVIEGVLEIIGLYS